MEFNDLAFKFGVYSTSKIGIKCFVQTTKELMPYDGWKSKLIDLAEKHSELIIIDKLKEYAFKNLYWIKKDKNAEEYALEMYSKRMHENINWLGYKAFNEMVNAKEEIEQISLI